MAGRSKVKDLPEALRSEVDRLLRERRFTLDEIVAHLRQLGGDTELPSRSSIGRYAKSFEAVAERLRRSQELADRLTSNLGPQVADGRLTDVLGQLIQDLAFERIGNLGEGETFDPKDISFLAGAAKDVASAQKISADRALKIRESTKKKAADAAEAVGKSKGLSADTVAAIRHAVLGVEA